MSPINLCFHWWKPTLNGIWMDFPSMSCKQNSDTGISSASMVMFLRKKTCLLCIRNWPMDLDSNKTCWTQSTRRSKRQKRHSWKDPQQWEIWQCVKTLYPFCSHQNSWDLWMFIPLKMVLIGIDPYPSNVGLVNFWNWNLVFWIRRVHFGSRSMVYFAGKSWEIYNLVFEEKTFFGWVSRIGHVPCKPSVPFLMFFVLEVRVYSISGRGKWSRLIIQPLIGIFGASMPLSSK